MTFVRFTLTTGRTVAINPSHVSDVYEEKPCKVHITIDGNEEYVLTVAEEFDLVIDKLEAGNTAKEKKNRSAQDIALRKHEMRAKKSNCPIWHTYVDFVIDRLHQWWVMEGEEWTAFQAGYIAREKEENA